MLDLPKTIILSIYLCDTCGDHVLTEKDTVEQRACGRIYPAGGICKGIAWLSDEKEYVEKNKKGERQPKWDNSKINTIEYNQ